MPIEQHYGGCKNACATRNENRVAARQEVRATRNEKRRREMEKNRCPGLGNRASSARNRHEMKSCRDRATGKLLAMVFAQLKLGSAETRERAACRAPSNCLF